MINQLNNRKKNTIIAIAFVAIIGIGVKFLIIDTQQQSVELKSELIQIKNHYDEVENKAKNKEQHKKDMNAVIEELQKREKYICEYKNKEEIENVISDIILENELRLTLISFDDEDSITQEPDSYIETTNIEIGIEGEGYKLLNLLDSLDEIPYIEVNSLNSTLEGDVETGHSLNISIYTMSESLLEE